MKEAIKEILDGNAGVLPAFTVLGGYPVGYQDREGNELCQECAQKSVKSYLEAGEEDQDGYKRDLPVSHFMIVPEEGGQDDDCDQCSEALDLGKRAKVAV